VAAGIVDRDWRVSPDRLEELAKRVPAMDLTTERSLSSKTSALGEVMINAVSIRNFLSNALDAGCVVARLETRSRSLGPPSPSHPLVTESIMNDTLFCSIPIDQLGAAMRWRHSSQS
jgi:hypothetical protein